ncbi:MAG: Lon-like protease [Frankiaceae bacterium]|nr:Lon-like protease [Frankiaceae bacterium]
MPRRAVVLLVSGLLCVVLAAACLFIPVPYAAIAPGPTFNALGDAGGKPIVGITGHATAATDGQLRLVTIQAYGKPQRLMVGDILRGWLDSSIAVVPLDDVFPETQTTQQQDEQGAQQMLDSQLEAKVAALSALHIPMTVVVKDTQSASPAAKVLKAGDEIVSVDGTPIDTITALTKAIGAHKPGENVSVTYRRDGVLHTDLVGTVAAGDGTKRPIIGVTPDVKLPFTVDIQLPNVGGPSAGLMFSLAIYDKLSDGHLAGGRTIAGTGTIDADGVVGPIGGIQQKVYAARRDGATVFLVPHSNCPDIKTVPAGLELVDVANFANALADLATLRSGGTPPGCAAP